MNPYDEVQRERLFRAVESSYRGLEPFRNLNSGLVEDYMGSCYGRYGRARYETIANLMQQTVDAYTMGLVANRPRILVSTHHPEFTYFARQFQAAVNSLIEEIGLEMTLRRWVLDAFFCVGFVKVHMADSGQVMVEPNLLMDPGTPFASNVALDNWVHDMGATNWYEMRFAGDMYRIPHADLVGSNIFDQNVVKDIPPSSKYDLGEEALAKFSRGEEIDADELEPMVTLADVWVPRDMKIYTYAVDSMSFFRLKGSPVAVMDWDGPEFGPYHKLGFGDVPENIMPSSPASHLWTMHKHINNILRKNSKRARNQKRQHTYTSGGKDAAAQSQKMGDDAWILVNDPKEIGEINIGGVDAASQQFALQMIELYDRMAGNLTAMLGLGAQAETVGQEELIHGAVSKQEAKMQYRVIDGAKRVIRDLGWMLWKDQHKTIRTRQPVEGAEGYFVDMTWTPEDREGDFFDYNFDIDLYSLPYQSSGKRMQALNTILTQIYAPMAQMLMMQGGQINLQKLASMHAEMLNEPRIRELIQFVNVVDQDVLPPQSRNLPSPAATTRTNIRRSIPSSGTAAGRMQQMQQAWAGMETGQNSGLTSPAA